MNTPTETGFDPAKSFEAYQASAFDAPEARRTKVFQGGDFGGGGAWWVSGVRPRYFEDPAVDKTLSITLALAGKIAVLRDRTDSIERLLEGGKPVSRAAVDGFVPDAAVRTERDAWRETYLDTVFRIVHEERGELQKRAAEAQPYGAAIDLVEKG